MKKPINSAWYDFKGLHPKADGKERRAFYCGAWAVLKLLTSTHHRDSLLKDMLRDLRNNGVTFD